MHIKTEMHTNVEGEESSKTANTWPVSVLILIGEHSGDPE